MLKVAYNLGREVAAQEMEKVAVGLGESFKSLKHAPKNLRLLRKGLMDHLGSANVLKNVDDTSLLSVLKSQGMTPFTGREGRYLSQGLSGLKRNAPAAGLLAAGGIGAGAGANALMEDEPTLLERLGLE